jgi:hypothetical protein
MNPLASTTSKLVEASPVRLLVTHMGGLSDAPVTIHRRVRSGTIAVNAL